MSEQQINGSRSGGMDEARIESRRYLGAMRRGRNLIIGITIALTAAVIAISLALPKTYEATGTIAVNSSARPDASFDDISRLLETYEVLVTSNAVLDRAIRDLPGLTAGTLSEKVVAAADSEANLLTVTGSDELPSRAADIANAVADAFILVRRNQTVGLIDEQIAQQNQRLNDLPNNDQSQVEESLIRSELAELQAAKTRAGSELAVVETASVPTGAASPKPVRNAVLALIAGAFFGVLAALARDQLRPGISDPRELSRISGMNVMAGIPYVSGRLARSRQMASAIEHESYQALGAAVQLALPASGQHVIMVTSASHGEGKTTVTARLGRVLAEAGHKTLLISGDLRWPRLHEIFGVGIQPGLADALSLIERAGPSRHILPATVHEIPLSRDAAGEPRSLDFLASGVKPTDPAQLLSSEAVGAFFQHVREFPYSYVLVDGPPLLGIVDGQGLAQQADRVLVTTRLDQITMEQVLDLRELLDRLQVSTLGSVVIGARIESSPYFQSERSLAAHEANGYSRSESSSYAIRQRG